MTTEQTPRDRQIVAAVEGLIEAALERTKDTRADETLTCCHLCDEWEGHKDGCPIPWLLVWQDM